MGIVKEERIGNQRLILGDCRDVVSYLDFDCVVCDPPFGMEFRSNHRKQRHDAILNDADPEALAWACKVPVRHSRYVWMRWDNLPEVPKPKSLITWVKNNHSMGDLDHEHARKTEVCAFYAGEGHRWPKYRPSDVVEHPRTGNEHHPTEKPVSLMMEVVGWTEGVVCDLFMGSASTLVACQKLGRAGIGIELDPQHFETACRRVDEAARQPDLLIPETQPKPTQESFL